MYIKRQLIFEVFTFLIRFVISNCLNFFKKSEKMASYVWDKYKIVIHIYVVGRWESKGTP